MGLISDTLPHHYQSIGEIIKKNYKDSTIVTGLNYAAQVPFGT